MALPQHGHDDFRRAAGQRDWAAAAEAAQADAQAGSGRRRLADVRTIYRRRRTPHAPGSVLIGTGGWLLALLGAGLFYVSFTGQYKYIFAVRDEDVASAIESGMLDLGMVIFTVLALGLARAGKPARVERALILACAIGSAGMNYLAADLASLRSVIAYTAAPVFLAVVVDRVVAVIRRHARAADETSPWSPLGRFLAGLARAAGLLALYSLRFVLAPPSTVTGLRRVVLNASPLPAPPVTVIAIDTRDELDEPDDERRELDSGERPGSKKARLLAAYRLHAQYGDRDVASKVAAELAAAADLQPGTARTYLYAELDRLAQQNGASS